MAVAVLLTLLLFFLPALLNLSPLSTQISPSEEADILTPLTPSESTSTDKASYDAPTDEKTTVLLERSDGSIESLTMEDYLFGVVAAEMPASFQLEALKAQTVAARTYTVSRQASGSVHENGAVCDDSSCCQAYVDKSDLMTQWGENYDFYSDKIQTAVAETDGLLVLYEGEPIEALFFAAAAGRTVDAADVWGNEVAYLVGVNSPEGSDEVPDYYSQVTLSKSEVQAAILATYPGADLSGDYTIWLSSPTYTTSGSVATLQVGGLSLTGSQVRNLFSLRSATFSYHWEGTNLIFSVTGYGHGVGMSQYGANALAAEGWGFQEILEWYYTGAEVG